MDAKYTTKAKVTLTIEISVGDRWGRDCSMAQVYDQAGESAIGMIRQWQDKDPAIRQRVKIIGVPKIDAITSTQE